MSVHCIMLKNMRKTCSAMCDTKGKQRSKCKENYMFTRMQYKIII